jgi:hypothetical protein
MKQTMKHPVDNIIGFFSGIAGGGAYAMFANITWRSILDNAGQLMWMAFVALVSGGAGVIGKHLADKYLKRKK